jgi:hypothetical protein
VFHLIRSFEDTGAIDDDSAAIAGSNPHRYRKTLERPAN